MTICRLSYLIFYSSLPAYVWQQGLQVAIGEDAGAEEGWPRDVHALPINLD